MAKTIADTLKQVDQEETNHGRAESVSSSSRLNAAGVEHRQGVLAELEAKLARTEAREKKVEAMAAYYKNRSRLQAEVLRDRSNDVVDLKREVMFIKWFSVFAIIGTAALVYFVGGGL